MAVKVVSLKAHGMFFCVQLIPDKQRRMVCSEKHREWLKGFVQSCENDIEQYKQKLLCYEAEIIKAMAAMEKLGEIKTRSNLYCMHRIPLICYKMCTVHCNYIIARSIPKIYWMRAGPDKVIDCYCVHMQRCAMKFNIQISTNYLLR